LDVIVSLLRRRGIDLHTDWIRISKAGHLEKLLGGSRDFEAMRPDA
jgi:hypothetical protein